MHRMQVFNIATLVCAGLISNQALAQDAAIPPLKKGQLVYTVPNNFVPPTIGVTGLGEIQSSLSKLHHPYYVVIMDNLPPGSGGDDQRAAKTVNDIARIWATTSSDIFTATSSVFLLSYHPRKYRFIAGARWTNSLGFANEAHKPYTNLFETAVKKTPADTIGGILNMARAVDEYVFDATDPERIKQRQAEEMRKQEAKKLSDAREALRLEVKRLQELLLHTSSTLRANTEATDRAELVKAGHMLDNATAELDVNKLQAATQNLKTYTDALEKDIEKKQSEISQARAIIAGKALGLLSLIIVALYLLNRRYTRTTKARRELNDEIESWKAKISHAEVRYAAFHERQEIADMGHLTGESARLQTEVTFEVDSIFVGVQALKAHVFDIEKRGARGGFFRPELIEKAHTDLSAPFDFDVESVDQAQLFGSNIKIAQFNPVSFSRTLEKRYADAMNGWKKLLEARKSQLIDPEQRFPMAGILRLEAVLREHEIPNVWLKNHPLADQAERAPLYAALSDLQLNNPLAYDKRIAELKKAESEVEQRVSRLIEIVAPVAETRPKTLKLPEGTIVDVEEHPEKLLAIADTAQVELAGMLASEKPMEVIEAQAKKTTRLYNEAIDQAERISFAVQKAQTTINGAISCQSEATEARKVAAEAVGRAQKQHLNVQAQSFFTEGDLQASKALDFLTKAQSALEAKRHLEARRKADEAKARFDEAKNQYAKANSYCQDLEAGRIRYESNIRAAHSMMQSAQTRIRAHGGSANLPAYNTPSLQGPVNYALLNQQFEETRQSWENEARAAEDRHRREVAAAAQAQADANRRAAEAQRQAAASSSYSSNSSSGSSYGSSSSGGSYGGGGDSSSGSSFGGGGDSSSGGDW